MRFFITILFILLAPFILNAANDFDQIAKNLAGLTGDPTHQEEMHKLWSNYLQKNLHFIQEWQSKELAEDYAANELVLYPFSGPDVVHMLSFFPNQKNYLMLGLEDSGFPTDLDINKLSLSAIRMGVDSLLERSFFVTSEMWSDFNRARHGVLIPMLVLLKLMDYEIIDVEQIYLNQDAKIVQEKTNVKGIKILARHHDSVVLKEISYFGVSLANNHNIIHKYLANINKFITYLKAAQYALFSPEFSQLREVILEKSSLVLQDDSGIPYRYFKNPNWQINLYGKYQGTYGESFRGYKQPDLLSAYNETAQKPFNFSLGYGYKKISTCLMKMVKKDKVE